MPVSPPENAEHEIVRKGDLMSNYELEAMQRELLCHFESVSIRGQGQSSFLYATNCGRSVEVSAHQDGGWWIEFWGSSQDEGTTSEHKSIVKTVAEAVEEVAKWIR